MGEPTWLSDKHRPLNHKTFSLAALSGHLDVIKWLKYNGFEWDSDTCSSASLGGNIDVLVFALENGCPWSNSIITNAALRGHLCIIEWCFLNKFYKFDANDKSSVYTYTDSCENASFNGHMHILKWFYVKGFPMKSKIKIEMYNKASIGEHSEILAWLKRIGCFSSSMIADMSDTSSEESFYDSNIRVSRDRSVSMYEYGIF